MIGAMSFEDLEAGTLRPSPLPVTQVAAHAVFQINTKVTALRHLGDAIGTPRDTPALHGRLRGTRAEAMRLSRITSRKLKQAADAMDDGAGDTESERIPPYSKSKLAMDFQAALRDLRQVLQRILAAERQAISAAADSGTSAGQTQQQQQQLPATGIEEHETIVDERELGILEAMHAIAEIDDIFRNLVTLVDSAGGCCVDHVVDIEEIAGETSQGAKEENSGMVETAVSRSSSRCLLVFVLGLFLFIFLLMLV
jgi:syntaxin 7